MAMRVEVIGRTSSIQSSLLSLTSYSYVGIGCAFHKTFDLICVVDLAGGYEDHLEMMLSKASERHQKATPVTQQPSVKGGSAFQLTKGWDQNKENMSPGTWGKGNKSSWNNESPIQSIPNTKRGATGGSYGSPIGQFNYKGTPSQGMGTSKIAHDQSGWVDNAQMHGSVNIDDFEVEDW